MRILWLAHRDPQSPRSGGAEKTIFEISRRLVARGHSISLVTASWAGAPPRSELLGLSIRRYPGVIGPHLALPSLLKREKNGSRPDVIVEDLAHAVPWFSGYLSDLPTIAFFRHLHSRTLPGQVSPPLVALLTWVERQYPRIFPRGIFVAPSPSARNDLVRLGVDPRRIVVIGYGVDDSFFPRGPKSPQPTMIYFAGMRRYKRPEHAILALQGLLARGLNIRLTMVGTGPVVEELKNAVQRLGLQNRVDFTGRLGIEPLARRVSESWVHVQTSVAEGWGLTVEEATRCGTPTVAYDVPGIIDSVTDGANGVLVPDGDVSALVSAVQRVITDREAWQERCLSTPSSTSWDKVADEWETLLIKVTTRGS